MSGSDGQFAVPAGDPDALYRLAAELDGHVRTVADLSADGRSFTSRARTNADWSGGAVDAYSTFMTVRENVAISAMYGDTRKATKQADGRTACPGDPDHGGADPRAAR